MNESQTLETWLTAWATDAFSAAFPDVDLGQTRLEVLSTNEEKFGDYQCNGAMALAKALKQKPRDIAQAVVDTAVLPEGVDRVEIAGPGFINIFLDTDWVSARLLRLLESEQLGIPEPEDPKTVLLDYSGPNIAKPMHIGHIRSTVIGNALDRLWRSLGHKVISDNHLGDWGTQFGLIIMGYRNFLDEKALAESPVEELERIYVKSYEQSKSDPDWLERARAELVKLQQGDAENLALWEKFIELSLGEFKKVYARLKISFDLTRGESFYRERLAGVVNALEEKGLAAESEGAKVVFLEDEGMPVCIVQKSDGGYNYATSDLATIVTRVEEFDPDLVVYVTDERQQLHFRQVFAVASRMGYATRLVHVWFGLMRLPEGTFSTREGNVIKLEKLLDEAETRALELVQQASPEMPPGQQREVARCVGIGAMKYADLSQNPQSTVTFTWEKALALDGNSAPYLQYAYARIASVLDKYRERFPGEDLATYPLRLEEEVERRLALRALRFPDVVRKAAEAFRPNYLADYLYDLAQVYSSFYQTTPFLKADPGIRESRVRLCDIVARTLMSGLDLLGIETPKRI